MAARRYSQFKERKVGKDGARPAGPKGSAGPEASGSWGIKESAVRDHGAPQAKANTKARGRQT